MKKRMALLTCLSLLFFAGFQASLWADEDTASKASDSETPEPDAVETPATQNKDLPPFFLAEIKGEVYVVHQGDKSKADPPQKIEADDRVLTGKNSTAYFLFRDGGTIEVDAQSEVRVKDLKIDPKGFKAFFQMAVGKMKTILHKLGPSSSFEIEAGGVISGVRGTTFEVDYNKDKKEEATKTYEGTVYARVNGKEKLVEKGFGLVVGKSGSPLLSALGEDDLADFAVFLDSSTDLEKKKEIIAKQLIKRILEQQLKNRAPKSPVDLQFHF